MVSFSASKGGCEEGRGDFRQMTFVFPSHHYMMGYCSAGDGCMPACRWEQPLLLKCRRSIDAWWSRDWWSTEGTSRCNQKLLRIAGGDLTRLADPPLRISSCACNFDITAQISACLAEEWSKTKELPTNYGRLSNL